MPTSPHTTLREWALRAERHAGLLAVLAAFALYLPTLRYGFVFDDQMLIQDNRNLEWSALGRLLGSPLWAIGEHGVPQEYQHLGHFYRPLISLSYLVDKALYWGQPRGFHLTNCAMHALNVFLAYRVFSRFFPLPWQAAVLALVLGVHPNNSEVVAAIHGRTDLFASVFCLGALLVYFRPRSASPRLELAGFSLLFALALASKEQSLLLLPLLALLHWQPEAKELGLTFRARRAHWACAALVLVAFFALRSRAISGLPGLFWPESAGALASRLFYCALHGFKLASASLFPWGSYALTSELSFSPHLVTLEVFACVTVFALAFRNRPRLAVLGAAWFFACVGLAVFGSAAVYEGEFSRLSKRYAYMAMPGLLWLLGAIVFQVRARTALVLTRAAGALAVIALSVQTAFRNEVYLDSLTFWSIRTKELPNHELAYYNLGRELMGRGEHAAAAVALARAVQLNPRYMNGYEQVNLAISLKNLGRAVEARRVVQDALQLFPSNPDLVRLWNDAGIAPPAADQDLERWLEGAQAAQGRGQFARSLELLNQLHERRESHGISRFLSGFAKQKLGDLPGAIADYAIAIRHTPDYALIYVNLGYAQLEQNDPRRACENFERAESLLPENPNVAWGLAECRRQLSELARP
jgi:protein O-mannosyl-transferase